MTSDHPTTDASPAGEPFEVTADGSRLLGSRCEQCSTVTFPAQDTCPRCASDDVHRHGLQRTGTLWTWTVQTFPPKGYAGGAENFRPFGVGYIELAGELRVEARLTEADPARLRIGMPMRLVVESLPRRDGDVMRVVAFAPAAEEST